MSPKFNTMLNQYTNRVAYVCESIFVCTPIYFHDNGLFLDRPILNLVGQVDHIKTVAI